jgi:hypothetical protein
LTKGEELGIVYASRESLHELYYVSKKEGVSLDEYISRAAALTAIENLKFIETTYQIDLLALALMKQCKIESIFDAYYVAAALNQVPDHTIISTDEVFDRHNTRNKKNTPTQTLNRCVNRGSKIFSLTYGPIGGHLNTPINSLVRSTTKPNKTQK